MLKEEEQTFMPPLALNLVYGNFVEIMHVIT